VVVSVERKFGADVQYFVQHFMVDGIDSIGIGANRVA
jgi:hypothetical protein